jgi:cyclophilin family peptidyl-prolyl cis-trans isomerase/biopolymer transport protein ExbD
VGTEKRERQKLNRQQRLTELAAQQRRSKTKKRSLQVVGLVALVLLVVLIFNVTSGNDTSSVASTDTVLDTTSDTAVDTPTDSTTPAATTPVVTAPGATLTGDTKCPVTDGSQARVTKFEKAPPMCIDAAKKYTATFDTTEGTIVVALDTAKTPQTVNNFVTLARYKYYDGTVVFRTDTSIDIIQGGGLTNTDDPGYTIADEGSGYKYVEGDLAMARTGEPNSAGGQWFFVAGPKASALDGQGTYVNFAKVTSGLDVVKNILALSSGSGALGGVPSRNVIINSVTITES